jgi:hypothetical protein
VLSTFIAVLNTALQQRRQLRRAFSAVILLFVFFLPLHFHLSPAQQINKECSCLHGTRKQLALTDTAPTCAPVLAGIEVAVQSISVWTDSWICLENVRAPPSVLSL